MSTNHELIELEIAGWKALSTSVAAAVAFYSELLAGDVLMLLPQGTSLDNRDDVISAMSGAAWDDFSLADERVIELGRDAAVVAYRASARRGDDAYRAFFSSTYLRTTDGWRLRLHQQTPI